MPKVPNVEGGAWLLCKKTTSGDERKVGVFCYVEKFTGKVHVTSRPTMCVPSRRVMRVW